MLFTVLVSFFQTLNAYLHGRFNTNTKIYCVLGNIMWNPLPFVEIPFMKELNTNFHKHKTSKLLFVYFHAMPHPFTKTWTWLFLVQSIDRFLSNIPSFNLHLLALFVWSTPFFISIVFSYIRSISCLQYA